MIAVAAVIVVVVIGAGVLAWKNRGADNPPNAASGDFTVKLDDQSKLDGLTGQQLWANLVISGGPAYRLALTVDAPKGVSASTQLPDPGSVAAGATIGGLVTLSSALDAGDGKKDVAVTVAGCASDAEACPPSDRREAKTSFTVTLVSPPKDAVPPGVSSPAADRVIENDGGLAVKDEYSVLMKDGLDETAAKSQAIAAAKATGGQLTGGIAKIGVFDIAYPGTGENDWERITAQLKAQPDVADAWPREATPITDERLPKEYDSKRWDAKTGDAWNLRQIHADRAWDITTGSHDIDVGVIDVGIHSGHEDLKANFGPVLRYGPLPPNQFDKDGRPVTHGTHTSGLICAEGDNGKGVAGVAWSCRLHGYDVRLGFVTTEEVALAMVQSVDDGNRLVNMSLGSGRECMKGDADPSQQTIEKKEAVYRKAFTYARTGRSGKGTLFVISAGNGCTDVSKSPPASLAKDFPDVTLAVGSVNSSGRLSRFSNAGEGVPVAAGGGWAGKENILGSKPAVLSTVDFKCDVPKIEGLCVHGSFSDTAYDEMSGTSMAAPQVTGIGVLVADKHRDFGASQIRACIVASATEAVRPYDKGDNPPDTADRPGDVSPGDMKIVDAEKAVKCGDESVGPIGTIPPGAVTPPGPGGGSPTPTPTPSPQYQAPQVVVVMDTSGSMGDKDQSGKVVKIDAAKSALNDFINGLDQSTQVGLWSYPSPSTTPATNGCSTAGGPVIGSTATGTIPLNQSDMSARVRSMSPSGDTPTGPALRAAAGMFRGSGPRTIVLVSDGEPTCGEGGPDAACTVAKDLSAQGITSIYTVGFQLSPEGKSLMQCVATQGHGTYTDVLNGDELKDKIPELARAKLQLDLTLPQRTPLDIGSGQTPSAKITVKVTNTGNTDAYDVTANLAFDSRAGSIGSSNKRIGNLLKGESRNVVWDFRPNVSFNDIEVEFRATGGALNADEPPSVAKKTIVSGRVTVDQAGPLLKGKSNPVVFGDSYSSGEGTKAYDSETDTSDNSCHRSFETYGADLFPDQLVRNGHTRHIYACSGAISNDIYHSSSVNHDPNDNSKDNPAQITQYQDDADFQAHPADVALVTIGGNDIGFRDIIEKCVKPGNCDSDDERKERTDLLHALPQNLRLAYQAIDTQINAPDAIGKRKGAVAPILVLAYPGIFPEISTNNNNCAKDLSESEQLYAGSVGNRLNLVIFDTIEAMRAEGYPIFFVWDSYKSVRPDHTICASDRWINELDVSDALLGKIFDLFKGVNTWFWGKARAEYKARKIDDTSYRVYTAGFHPTNDGYKAMAAALVRYSNTPDGKRAVTHPPPLTIPWSGLDSPGLTKAAKPLDLSGQGATIGAAPGDAFALTTSGLAPNTPFEIRVESSPRVVAQGATDGDGRVQANVLVPPDLETGDHHLVLKSLDANGALVEQRYPLAVTIPPPWWWYALGVACAVLLVISAVLMVLSRRARKVDPSIG